MLLLKETNFFLSDNITAGKNDFVDKDKYFLSDNITAGKNGFVDKDKYLFCLIIQLHKVHCAHIINIR